TSLGRSIRYRRRYGKGEMAPEPHPSDQVTRLEKPISSLGGPAVQPGGRALTMEEVHTCSRRSRNFGDGVEPSQSPHFRPALMEVVRRLVGTDMHRRIIRIIRHCACDAFVIGHTARPLEDRIQSVG